mgnify:CR=1 FL=1
MQKIRIPFTNFSFGEVSESTILRTDTQIYQSSGQSIENLFLMSEGGLKKRPGTEQIYQFDFTKPLIAGTEYRREHRILPFIFSDDEKYLVVLSDARVDVLRLSSTSDAVTFSIKLTADTSAAALPFDEEYLHEYTYAQYGDIMFICHPLFAPRQLVRTGLDTFEVTTITFDQRFDSLVTYQPYSVLHAADTTLELGATSGTDITATASAAAFNTDGSATLDAGLGVNVYLDSTDLGTKIKYGDTEVTIVAVASTTVAYVDISGTAEVRLSILNPLRSRDGTAVVEVTHLAHGLAVGETVILSDATGVGGIVAADINGSRTILEILNENAYSITAGSNATSDADGGNYVTVETSSPTTQWTQQAFSARRGYPGAVCFHENRLCFAGTVAQPDTIWMSKSGRYYNFDVGTAADDDSINIVAASTEVQHIRYLVSSRDLQVFTASTELYIPSYQNTAITPTNATLRRQTPYGCTFVTPQPFDGATLFVQAGGRVVREYLFTDAEDAYSSTAISTIASHLVDDPVDLTICHGAFRNAESIAAFVRQNGEIALFNSNRVENRAGWTRITSPGTFVSVTAIEDRLFAIGWFDNNPDASGASRADEQLSLVEFNSHWGLDCSRGYLREAGSTEIDVSDIFSEGAVVDVIRTDGSVIAPSIDELEDGDGIPSVYLGQYTVPVSGLIDLGVEGILNATYRVGFAFDVEFVSNPIDASLRSGPQTGEFRGVSGVIADLRRVGSLSVNGRAMSITGLHSGKKEFYILGYKRDPQVTFTQNEPLAFQLNGYVAELVV